MSTMAKGAVVVATLDYLRTVHGDAVASAVMERISPETRSAFDSAGATAEVPLVLIYELWRAADALLAARHPTWMEEAGAHSITSKGMQLYGGIVQKTSPIAFLCQPVSLFRLFYRSGEMDVIEREEGRAVLRLHEFSDADPLFCRRQTGGLHRALELAGGRDAVVRHVRCACDDDAFCEWELTWTAAPERVSGAGQRA
jgi:hypothetical protein